MNRKPKIAWVSLLLFGALLALLLWSSDRQASPPGLSGDLWQVDLGDQTSICFISAESRERTGSRPANTWIRYTRVHLVRMDIRSGEIMRRIDLGDREREDPIPSIIGVIGDELWLSNGTVEVRDATTLQVQANTETFRAQNPAIASIIPEDQGLYTTASAFDSMTFKALDARYYRIQGPEWKAVSIEQDLADMGATTAFFGPSSLLTPVPTRALRSDFLRNADILLDDESSGRPFSVGPGTWFAMLSDRDLASIGPWAGSPHSISGETRRAPFLTACVRRAKGKDTNGTPTFEIELDYEKISAAGDRSYLFGGLLMSPRQGAAWRVDDSPAHLIASKQTIAKGDTWVIHRVSMDGSVAWSADTGLWELTQVVDAVDFVVIGGNAGPADRNKAHFALFAIDLADGSTRALSIAPGHRADP